MKAYDNKIASCHKLCKSRTGYGSAEVMQSALKSIMGPTGGLKTLEIIAFSESRTITHFKCQLKVI